VLKVAKKQDSPDMAQIQYDPRQTPAWRWHQASDRVILGRQPATTGDQWQMAATWLANWNQSGQEGNLHTSPDSESSELDRLALAAFGIFVGDRVERAIIEAGVLAGLDHASIADLSGQRPAVVEAFELLFYDIRHKLPYRNWILVYGLGWPWATRNAPDLPAVIKKWAYFLGPAVLAAVIPVARKIHNDAHPLVNVQFPDTGEKQCELRCRLAIASEILTPEEANSLPFARLCADMQRREQASLRSPLSMKSWPERREAIVEAAWGQYEAGLKERGVPCSFGTVVHAA
jgi:hypothetical protein